MFMTESDLKIRKPTLILRWKYGCKVLWRVVVFGLWFSIFNLPCSIVCKLYSNGLLKFTKPEYGIIILLILAVVNIPLALYFAAAETGFFRKYGEISQNI
jgi:hypothetical protein